ncbi:nickel pincer cofactor biosynthesis protein LarC [Ilumatobacter sp.]|uniref:nickel pincer cofactor biosynthesis protein LarC n=1 Tax=Ilumatobacter sp. TaxID=1967498 RepID=UPI003B52C0DA
MIGWIDGTAGASGDMLLGALVGAGVPLAVPAASIDALDLGVRLRSERVRRAGLAATRVHVEVPDSGVVRDLDDVVGVLAPLDAEVRGRAESTFRRLAAAEAEVHGIAIADVHFHEVGALDSIADVVGVCAGFVHLGLDRLVCSTLSLGGGRTRGAHGPLPVPVPAVLAVLGADATVTAGPARWEATTPTGAALLAEWVDEWGPLPTLRIGATGSGAGERDGDEVANACRLVIGDAADGTVGGPDPAIGTGVALRIDANVDDCDPRIWPGVVAAALAAGALDAWTTPVLMKKGRPATTLSVLCDPHDAIVLRRVVFDHTTTIGVREHLVTRHVLERTSTAVRVGGHEISVKVASIGGEVVNRSVEWDDVVAAARSLGRPPADVLAEANAAARVEVPPGRPPSP